MKRGALSASGGVGLLLGGILFLNAFALYYFNTGGEITIIPCLVAYFFAGYQAAQPDRTIQKGALAGFLTAVISSVVGAIGKLFVDSTHVDAIRQRVQAEAVAAHHIIMYTNEQILTQRVLGLIAGLVLASIVGTGVGIVGAVVHLRRANWRLSGV